LPQVVDVGAVAPLLTLLESRDQELRTLATAVVANSLAYSDTLLLANTLVIDTIATAIATLLDLAKRYSERLDSVD
jgi:hypothetical protein